MVVPYTSQYAASPIFSLVINFTKQNVLTQVSGASVFTDKQLQELINIAGSVGDYALWSGDKIISISPINSASDFDGGSVVSSVTVTIDDSEGYILNLLGIVNIQKIPAYIYLGDEVIPNFASPLLRKATLIFEGEIFSDFTWNDKDRTATFTIVNGFEAKQVGFSPEQGYIKDLRADLIGKPWPFGFGTVIKYPAIQLNYSPTCILTRPWGYHDHTLPNEANRLGLLKSDYFALAVYFYIAALQAIFSDQQTLGDDLTNQGDEALAIYLAVETNRISILQILTEQASFESREGMVVVSNIPVPLIGTWTLDGNLIYAKYSPVGDSSQYGGSGIGHLYIYSLLPQIGDSLIPYRSPSHRTEFTFVQAGSVATFVGKASKYINETLAHEASIIPTAVAQSNFVDLQTSLALEDPGKQSSYPLVYVVNCLGGNIGAVYATRNAEGASYIMPVPQQYWETARIRTIPPGVVTTVPAFTALGIVFPQPLSSIPGVKWTDDVYVSFTSGVGPDWHDVMSFIIGLYTPYGIDATSFNSIPGFQLNFCITEEKDAMTFIKEICWQCNVAVWLSDGTFHFQFLPAGPFGNTEITLDQIIIDSIKIGISPTENIITKIKATWFNTYQFDTRNYLQVRYNDARYGVIELDVDYYVFHDPSAIMQSMMFWLWRRGNTWQRFKCSVPLASYGPRGLSNFASLQIYDAVNLLLSKDPVTSDMTSVPNPLFGGGGIGSVVSVTIDTEKYLVELEIELATQSGSSVNSPSAYYLAAANGVGGLFQIDEAFGLTVKPAVDLALQRGLQISTGFAAEGISLEEATQFSGSAGKVLNITQPDPLNGTDLPSGLDIFSRTDQGGVVAMGSTGGGVSIPSLPDQKITQMNPKPWWDYNYINYPTSAKVQAQCCPGTIDSPSDTDGLWNCTVYIKGLDSKGSSVSAQILQEAKNDTVIPKGTWAIFAIVPATSTKSSTDIGVTANTDTFNATSVPSQDNSDGNNYYFSVPIWLL